MMPIRFHPSTGSIEVVCGCMFAGKTEELIRRLRRALYAKLSVKVFKPVIDNRYDATNLVSHEGLTLAAVPVKDVSEIVDQSVDARVIGIDEAQFFSEDLALVAEALANRGKRVVVAGLDLDYRGHPFGPMPTLMALADSVHKITAVCTVCGAVATRTQRIVASEEQVLVGGQTVYQARCREHWSPEPVFSRQDQTGEMDG